MSGPMALVILADGTRPDLWDELLAKGDLPGVVRAFPWLESSRAVPRACTVFPSTTGPAHLPFVTGQMPGACDVPGIRWFDPEVYGSRPWSPFRFRSYMGLGNYLASRDLSRSVTTMFELEPDHASISGNVRRGVRPGRDLTRWSKLVHNVRSFFVQDWFGLDRVAGRKILTALGRGTRFTFAALYAADSNGHREGPTGERTMESYRLIDRVVGDATRFIQEQGLGERVLMALVSDHGMSETHTHLDLAGLVDRIAGPCLAHPTLWRGPWAARSAVMVSGNAMAHVYLRSRDGWGRRVWLDEGDPTLERLLEALLAEPAVDLVAGRRSDGAIEVRSHRGGATIRGDSWRELVYEPGPAGDPFGYPAALRGRFTHQGFLAATWDTDYPDAPVQLRQVFDSRRCGDLVVSAAPGYDLRARFERPAHVGSHGSLHRLHMMTPFLVGGGTAGPTRTVELFPMLRAHLSSGSLPPPGAAQGHEGQAHAYPEEPTDPANQGQGHG